MQEFGVEVIRDSGDKINKQKNNRKTGRSQNQKSEWQRYEGAGRNSKLNKFRKANKSKGAGKSCKSKTKGVYISIIWHTGCSAQKIINVLMGVEYTD